MVKLFVYGRQESHLHPGDFNDQRLRSTLNELRVPDAFLLRTIYDKITSLKTLHKLFKDILENGHDRTFSSEEMDKIYAEEFRDIQKARVYRMPDDDYGLFGESNEVIMIIDRSHYMKSSERAYQYYQKDLQRRQMGLLGIVLFDLKTSESNPWLCFDLNTENLSIAIDKIKSFRYLQEELAR